MDVPQIGYPPSMYLSLIWIQIQFISTENKYKFKDPDPFSNLWLAYIILYLLHTLNDGRIICYFEID